MQNSEYVRGAKMFCNCGTHVRRINLPQSHGSFVNDKPMMNEEDNKFTANVPHFGICVSPLNPSGETIYLIREEDGQNIGGKPCEPLFLDKWLGAKESVKVGGLPALTSESGLICGYEGCIRFGTNGQHDED